MKAFISRLRKLETFGASFFTINVSGLHHSCDGGNSDRDLLSSLLMRFMLVDSTNCSVRG